ncbi:uncharacterized protein LOC125678626 isoform X3 [Ostrea edulis]|uniref:uncharacterized protein LOC125678626 isoform X3 n=1 Tax=Ostrea edulis TaxID=37623 RepID=UPI0020963FB9|nr:uncharacterized protein LOC125678626 isoform X3 [Ostrea edulis]
MSCNWQNDDYFSLLMSTDKKAHVALEMLVDDLHGDKERTVHKFLGHSGAEDFLYGLVRLLGSDNPRVAGNAAYIIGTVAETDMGCYRILGLAKSQQGERKILADLTRMLTFDDSESVMNAAGTMGTLAESYDGREWMLANPCLSETLNHITTLLQAENLWTASNAALVLARLAISENGCIAVLQHEHSQHILSKLVQSLGVDEAGRGMNAAFAIGRLCDMEVGRKRLLMLSDSERMLSSLAKMLSCDDTGASKNACFALSCLATNAEGHARLLKNIHSDNILRTLSELLSAEDSETGWFAAMTLRTLASQPRGCLRLRDHPQVLPALQAVDKGPNMNSDLKEEASITLEILKRLDRPSPPTIEVLGHNSMKASWEEVPTKSGFTVRYQLFDGSANKCVYTGKDLTCQIFGLQPCSQYTYKLRAFTEGDESPFSDPVTIVTEENVPTAPINLRVLGCTITQLKIGWDPPEQLNGTLKGYYIFLDDKVIDHTQELTSILTGLTANTSYQVEVCAATSRGKGEKSYVVGTTSEIGAHAPSKPHVQVLGRNELHITWEPPEVPLGRITRYDVLMNGKIIYSGTDLSYTVRRLTPDTEYSFVIVALTSEGKFDSKATKRRTAKDEYDSSRPPLYQAPSRRDSMGEVSNVSTTVSKKKKAASTVESKRQAASGKHRSLTPGNLRSKTPADQVTLATRPVSGSSCTSTIPEKESKENRETEQKDYSRTSDSQHNNADRVPTKSAPVHNVHFRETQHQSIPRNPSTKPERLSHVNKMFPLSVSYVSIQGNDEKDKEDKKLHKSGTFIENSNSNPMHGLRVERSRTTMHSSHVKRRTKVIENNGPINQNLIGQEYLTTLLGKTPEALQPKPAQDVQFSVNSHPIESNVSRQPTQASTEKQAYSETASGKQRKMSPILSQNPNKPENTALNQQSRARGSKDRPNKEVFLPKPVLPSQQYLEGRSQQGLSTPYGSRSLPSPRSLYLQREAEAGEHENQQKKRISSVQPQAERTNQGFSLPNIPQRGNYRTVRKVLNKYQPPESVPSMPVVPSAQTFNLDIPENKSTMTTWNRTFIPMQLRTQPSNLPPSQLQRMNTTLGDQAKGVQFKRVDALTRSKTVIDLKQNTTTLGEQAERFPITQSANIKGRSSPHLKSNTKSLTRSPSAHYKEPDSVLLKKSWSLSSSHEGTQLSAR